MGLSSPPKERIVMAKDLIDGLLKSILLLSIAKSLLCLRSREIGHLELKVATCCTKGRAGHGMGDFGSAKVFGLAVTQTSKVDRCRRATRARTLWRVARCRQRWAFTISR
jgi:hypothetical protein